jgi:hypothetical protein
MVRYRPEINGSRNEGHPVLFWKHTVIPDFMPHQFQEAEVRIALTPTGENKACPSFT